MGNGYMRRTINVDISIYSIVRWEKNISLRVGWVGGGGGTTVFKAHYSAIKKF